MLHSKFWGYTVYSWIIRFQISIDEVAAGTKNVSVTVCFKTTLREGNERRITLPELIVRRELSHI